jgi:hypothetical protein
MISLYPVRNNFNLRAKFTRLLRDNFADFIAALSLEGDSVSTRSSRRDFISIVFQETSEDFGDFLSLNKLKDQYGKSHHSTIHSEDI